MAIVRGAFNELLRPGLRAAWEEAYSDPKLTLGYRISKEMMEDDLYNFAERRTGVHEVFPGQLWFTDPPKSLEVPEYPPTDWPKRWWPKFDWP